MNDVSANPRISAVITTYNNASFLAEAIESVLAQTRPLDEILVVDDGSTDETRRVVSAYSDKGVDYIYQPNQGAGAARNLGIRSTRGDLIAFLDADDLWLEEKTRLQDEVLLAQPELALVSGGAWWWNIETGKRWQVPLSSRSAARGRRDILVHNWIGNPSMVLLRRSVLEKTGLFDPSLRWGQDWELWIRIVSLYAIEILPDPVIVYRSHAKNLSHATQGKRLGCFWAISYRAIAAYQPAWQRPGLLARAWSHVILQRGEAARNEGESRWKQAGYASLAILSYPFEEIKEKIKLLARALLSEGVYRWLRAKLKANYRSPSYRSPSADRPEE
jgi:glycosyltransferase involved in cell wall biosynthesis